MCSWQLPRPAPLKIGEVGSLGQEHLQHHGQQPTIQRPAAKGFRELPKGRGFHSLGLSHSHPLLNMLIPSSPAAKFKVLERPTRPHPIWLLLCLQCSPLAMVSFSLLPETGQVLPTSECFLFRRFPASVVPGQPEFPLGLYEHRLPHITLALCSLWP